MNLARRFLSAVLLVSATAFALSAYAQHYDELRDENGKIRAEYKDVYMLFESMNKTQQQKFISGSRKAFSGDNALSPLPRVISPEEYDNVIVKGVQQRGKAILAFLRDYYSGGHTYTGIVPEAVVKRIIERNNEAGYDGHIPVSVLAFPYGPDMIRDASGNWRVIEDNPGFIGGPGDLKVAQQFLFDNLPGLKDKFQARDPEVFYKQLADDYKARARRMGGKAVLLFSGFMSDGEDERVKAIFASHGIEAVHPDKGDLQLKITPEGVFTFSKAAGFEASKEKVGFTALLGEHAWFDPTNQGAWERAVVEEARILQEETRGTKLKKDLQDILDQPRSPAKFKALTEIVAKRSASGDPLKDLNKTTRPYHGLINAILSEKVAANYSPGVDFIGDKEFYIYVEDFIRHYLNEEPILKNIDTLKFSDAEGHLDREALEKVTAQLKTFVIKRVDGRGGKSVWIGPKMTDDEMLELKKAIVEEPDFYIAQAYTPPSVLNGSIVDIRAISDVSLRKVQVANTGWGRGIPVSGDGKVNLSANGREFTVLVRDAKAGSQNAAARGRDNTCRDAFAK